MNITYYLGAGASYNALPVVNEINARLMIFKAAVDDESNTWEYNIYLREVQDINIKEVGQQLSKDIDWVINEAHRHQTVDTLAKKLFVLQDGVEDLLKLKRVLTVYFLFEQFYKGNIRPKVPKELPDKRYDSFIASIISTEKGKLKLPGEIKIITWNYDLQFELSIREYLKGKTISEIQEWIQGITFKKLFDF
jgi:hypothetical protein